MRKFIHFLEGLVGKENVKCNANLKNYLTFKVDCVAKILIEVYNRNTLIKVLDFLTSINKKYFIIGGGSNVLFSKFYVKDIVIYIGKGYSKIYEKNGKYYLSTFSGNKVCDIIQKCKGLGLSCIEWAIGIPASIGGATIMNMGAFENCIADKIVSVTYYEKGKIKTIKNCKNLFTYRKSVFKDKKCVIISVVLSLTKKSYEEVQKDLIMYQKMKASAQPLNYPSCGCIFKNGENYKVAKLIQDCNLKGWTVGGAQVSIKHSNFIVNFNNATIYDILSLIKIIKQEVYKKFGIKINEELIVI